MPTRQPHRWKLREPIHDQTSGLVNSPRAIGASILQWYVRYDRTQTEGQLLARGTSESKPLSYTSHSGSFAPILRTSLGQIQTTPAPSTERTQKETKVDCLGEEELCTGCNELQHHRFRAAQTGLTCGTKGRPSMVTPADTSAMA